MNRTQKYLINGAILSLSAVLIRAVSVGFNIYLTSEIGAEGMGLITLIGSVYGLFITLATSGVSLAVTRLISASEALGEGESERRRIVKSAITYALIFSVSASVILLVSARNVGVLILKDGRTVAALRILAFTLTPIAVSSVINGYFSGRMKVKRNVFVSIFESSVRISLSVLLLSALSKKTVEHQCIAVILSGALSEGVSLLILLALYSRDISRSYTDQSRRSRKKGFYLAPRKRDNGFCSVFSLAFPIGAGAYVRSALSSVEHIAIPRCLAKSSLGALSLSAYGILHGTVFPLLTFPSAVLNAFSSLLVPELSSAHALGERERIKRTASSVIGVSLLFSIGISGIFVSLAEEIGVYLLGSAEAGEYVRYLAPLIPLMYLDSAVDSMLKGLGEQLYSLRVNICDSLLSIVLIFILVPPMGIRGYVAVIFITEIFNFSLSLLRLITKWNTDTSCVKWVLKPLLSIISSSLIVKALTSLPYLSHLSLDHGKGYLYIKMTLLALFYLLISRLSGAISKRDVSRAKGVLKLSTLPK